MRCTTSYEWIMFSGFTSNAVWKKSSCRGIFAIKIVKFFKNNKKSIASFLLFQTLQNIRENATVSLHSHIYNSHSLKVFDFALHGHP